MDSDATDHICPDLHNFEEFQSIADKDNTITVPDGRKIRITHIGIVKLSDDIVLREVLHVPDFHYKLISVHKLCKDMNSKLIFNNTQYFIHDHIFAERSSTAS